jgi:hypothetical protein
MTKTKVTTKINLDEVESIQLVEARQSQSWRWEEGKPSRKSFFGLIATEEVKPGWYYYESGPKDEEYIFKESSDAGRIFKNKEVLHEYSIWQKPYLNFRMRSKNTYIKYFNNLDEARIELEDITKEFPNVTIEHTW